MWSLVNRRQELAVIFNLPLYVQRWTTASSQKEVESRKGTAVASQGSFNQCHVHMVMDTQAIEYFEMRRSDQEKKEENHCGREKRNGKEYEAFRRKVELKTLTGEAQTPTSIGEFSWA